MLTYLGLFRSYPDLLIFLCFCSFSAKLVLRTQAQTAYRVVLESYGHNPKLVRLYGKFLQTIKNDPWRAVSGRLCVYEGCVGCTWGLTSEFPTFMSSGVGLRCTCRCEKVKRLSGQRSCNAPNEYRSRSTLRRRTVLKKSRMETPGGPYYPTVRRTSRLTGVTLKLEFSYKGQSEG